MLRNVLILEDNKTTSEYLSKMIRSIDKNVVIHSSDNLRDAYQIVAENVIDVFLLDIVLYPRESGDISGMVFAKKLRKQDQYKFTPIIFITSLEDPEMYAYSRIHSYSYIEKPFDQTRVLKILEEALQYKTKGYEDKEIYFRMDGIIYAVWSKDIIYIENRNRKMEIHLKNEVIEVQYRSFRDLFIQLDSPDFLQCSRYTVVNKRHVRKIDFPNRFIELDTGTVIELGSKYKMRFAQGIEA